MSGETFTDGIIPILLPNTIRGQNTSVHPTALSEGEFPLLQNLRISERLPVVRQGSRLLAANAPANAGVFKGAWSGTLGQTTYIIGAFKDPGSSNTVRVYSLDTSTWSWNPITTDTGPFGYTTLLNGPFSCQFVKVPYDRDGQKRDVLLMHCYSDYYPRIFDPAASTGFQVAKVVPIPLPGTSAAYKAMQTLPKYVDIQGGTFTTPAKTGYLNAVFTGTNPGRYIKLTWPHASVANETTTIELPSAGTLDLSACRQLLMRVYDTGSASLLSKLRVLISEDNSTYFTIGDPTELALSPVTISDDVSGVVWYVYSLDGIATESRNAIRYIRFLAPVTNLMSSDTYCKIGLIAGGGNIAGLSDWCVAYRNHYSRVESPRQVLSVGSMAAVTTLGGCNFGTTSSSAERIPNSELIYYTYVLAVPNPNNGATITSSAVGLNDYPTKADFYVRYAGTTEYGYFGSKNVYEPSGSNWTGTTSGATISATFGTSVPTDMDETLYPPDSMHGYIPRPVCMLYNGSRLLFGGDQDQQADVYFSDDRQPFRFRKVARFLDATNMDPGSGSRVTLPTQVVAMSQTSNVVSGVEFGVPTMIIWARTEAYRLYGIDCATLSRPTALGPHGLATSKAIAKYEDAIYWLDDERQVRKLSSDGIVPISRGAVDSVLRAGEVNTSSTEFYRDRLYLSYRKIDDTQTIRLLIWDEHPVDQAPGSWTEDKLAAGAEQLVVYDTGDNDAKLLFITSTGQVWQHEAPNQGTDNGTPIEVKIVTREFQQRMWDAFWIKGIGIVADGCGSGSRADIVATYKPNGATASWSLTTGNPLSLDSGDAQQIWRRTTDTPVISTQEIRGLSCTLEITATMPAGARIYAIRGYVEPRDGKEDIG